MKIFLGLHIDKEFKMHMQQSLKWKESISLGQSEMIETTHQDKDYVGIFIPHFITCREIQQKELALKAQMHMMFPKLSVDKRAATLFTQVFIS